jgi:hypothetical protein
MGHYILLKDSHSLYCTLGVTLFGDTPEGKRPLGRPRHRREDNIKTDLREIVWEGVAQDRDQWRALAKAVMKLRIP